MKQTQRDQSTRTVDPVGDMGTKIKFTWLSQGWQCDGGHRQLTIEGGKVSLLLKSIKYL